MEKAVVGCLEVAGDELLYLESESRSFGIRSFSK
jgi:hypothetical protein